MEHIIFKLSTLREKRTILYKKISKEIQTHKDAHYRGVKVARVYHSYLRQHSSSCSPTRRNTYVQASTRLISRHQQSIPSFMALISPFHDRSERVTYDS